MQPWGKVSSIPGATGTDKRHREERTDRRDTEQREQRPETQIKEDPSSRSKE
jgi:hypothetical protein